MTDDSVKEARNKTAKTIVAKLLGSLEATPLNISIIETLLVGYEQSIIRVAERLAKIEALEEVVNNAIPGFTIAYVENQIAELKEAGE